ncbi:hypothetical protein ACJJTC_000045 [Scirpophaga incertulas]
MKKYYKVNIVIACAGGGGGGGGNKSRVYAVGGALADVQMRPAANSLMFTANRLSRPAPAPHPPSQYSRPVCAVVGRPTNREPTQGVCRSAGVLAPTFASAPIVKEPAITIKPAPDKKDKPKKDKVLLTLDLLTLQNWEFNLYLGVNKEEACRLGAEAVQAAAAAWPAGADEPPEPAAGELAAAEPLRRLRDLQPDKLLRRALGAALDAARAAPDPEGERYAWAAVVVARAASRTPLTEQLRALAQAVASSAETDADEAGGEEPAEPGSRRARLAELTAHALRLRALPATELGAWASAGGARRGLALDALRALERRAGADGARRLLQDAALDAGALAGAAHDPDAALARLEARGLAALAPQLAVRARLRRQLAAEPQPAALYRWIKANVEPAVRADAAFVSTLVALVAERVSAEAGAEDAGGGGGGGGGAGTEDERAALERERALLEAYAPLLTALLAARPALQLAAVYAVQLHAHRRRYPQGHAAALDVTDAYPGKGEALFQVNAWLTWLQQQESEDEEAED